MPGVTCKLVKEKPSGGGGQPLVYQVRFAGKGNAAQRFAVMWAPYAVYERFTGSVHWTIDPEVALRRCNAKFERRFRAIETALAGQGRKPEDVSLDELEGLWQAAKATEG